MANLLRGRATSAGTRAYAARLAGRTAAGHFRDFRGLTVSSVGLGTYLGGDDGATDAQYREAILRALELGANVLDSAINYRNQRSERAVGAALRTAVEQGIAAREEVVVATKGGFLSFDGGRPANPRAYLEETYFRPGVMRPSDIVAGCHVMTPSYLRDQLARSRANLGVETIDVYYLHNPETQLEEVPRHAFLERIRAAFQVLEQACAAGEIGLYGTATWNGYRVPAGETGHLSLAELLDAARQAGGEDHHFRVVQLPYNLAMPEAAIAPTQAGRPFLAAAAEAGILVMTSASVLQGKLTSRLPPRIGAALAGLSSDAQRAIQFVRSTPGVTTALVGMKRAAHVEENLAVAAVAPAPEAIAPLFPGVAT